MRCRWALATALSLTATGCGLLTDLDGPEHTTRGASDSGVIELDGAPLDASGPIEPDAHLGVTDSATRPDDASGLDAFSVAPGDICTDPIPITIRSGSFFNGSTRGMRDDVPGCLSGAREIFYLVTVDCSLGITIAAVDGSTSFQIAIDCMSGMCAMGVGVSSAAPTLMMVEATSDADDFVLAASACTT